MTGTLFVWIVVVVLIIGILISIYFTFFGKAPKTKPYTFTEQKEFETLGIEEQYGHVYRIVLSSLRKVNPWFIKVLNDPDYINEALTITSRLPECKSQRDIFKVIDEEFFRWRGYGSLNPQFYDGIEEVARAIWLVWEKEENK